MKQKIFTLLLISCVFFSSCQKNSVKPDIKPVTGSQKSTASISTPANSAIDTLDNVIGSMRVQLAKDTINSDNILFDFKPTAKTTYVVSEDAPTFQGFGAVSLSSSSSDNIPLAINTLPLTRKGLSVGLRVSTKTDGIYKLSLLTIQSVPQAYDIWLMDKYRKDSLDIRHNISGYAFNVYKSDTTTYGNNRFKLVIRLR